MLKKLLKYDFLSIKRFVIPLLLLTPAVAFAVGMIGYGAGRVSYPLILIGLQTTYVFGLIALFLSIALLPVLLIVRYYTGVFSDAGYVTLMLPVSRKLLLLSKILNALILMLCYLIIAFFSIEFAVGAPQTIGSGHGILYAFPLAMKYLKNMISQFGGFSAGFVVAFVFYLIFLLTFMFSLFYTGVTLGAAIFQGRAKIGGAILFCVVSYLVWSVIKTSIEAIPTAILVANGAEEVLLNSTVLLIFLIAETLMYAGFSVGLFFLNARLIDRKLNLA